MSPPANPFVRSVKEAFREMRFAVRHEAGMIDHAIGAVGGGLRARAGAATRDLPPLHRALGAIPIPRAPVLQLADAVFGPLEKAAVRALAPTQDERPFRSLGSIMTLTRRDGRALRLDEAAFARRHYRLAHDVLHSLGVANLLLSEQAIEAAGRLLSVRHADLFEGLSTGDGDVSATEKTRRIGLCAAIAMVLERARPIRGLDFGVGRPALPQHLLLAPNLYAFVLIALATAVVSTGGSSDPVEAVEAAGTVADVRFGRFSAAMQSRDPLAALTREFATVVPHLP